MLFRNNKHTLCLNRFILRVVITERIGSLLWENGNTHLIYLFDVYWILLISSNSPPTLLLMPTACQQESTPAFELIFMGTGTSGSVPNISCLTAPPDVEPCQTCLSTLTPAGKKNIRRNTSAIFRADGVGGKKVYVTGFWLVDHLHSEVDYRSSSS